MSNHSAAFSALLLIAIATASHAQTAASPPETCAGIATHSLTGLRLWPNPATGSFNLQLPAGATLPATLALSDLSGRVVLRQPLTETLSTIDCSKLVERVYFWRVELDYTSVSGKLIIRGER